MQITRLMIVFLGTFLVFNQPQALSAPQNQLIKPVFGPLRLPQDQRGAFGGLGPTNTPSPNTFATNVTYPGKLHFAPVGDGNFVVFAETEGGGNKAVLKDNFLNTIKATQNWDIMAQDNGAFMENNRSIYFIKSKTETIQVTSTEPAYTGTFPVVETVHKIP